MPGTPPTSSPTGSPSSAVDNPPITQATSKGLYSDEEAFAAYNTSFSAPLATASPPGVGQPGAPDPRSLPFTIYEDPASPDDDLHHTPLASPAVNRILPAYLTNPSSRLPSPQRHTPPPRARGQGQQRPSTKPKRVRFQPYGYVDFLSEQIKTTTDRWNELLRAGKYPAALRETTAQLTLLYTSYREAVALQNDSLTDVTLLQLSSALGSHLASRPRHTQPE
ncbi:hypothetical protein BGW42_007351 [Actinomortierella wolfii]|nr:hypothetical protein BGW42_007351 [Actinomortierella wolfii]